MLAKNKKNCFQNSTKDKMTHFNISVTVKRRRYNSTYFKNYNLAQRMSCSYPVA